MRIPKYRLTDKEAAAIRVIGREGEAGATPHQLVAVTRSMWPEVETSLSRLEERGLVKVTTNDHRLANLTDEGWHLFRLLERPRQTMNKQQWTPFSEVWIVPDIANSESSQENGELEDLDAALEETIQKLRG